MRIGSSLLTIWLIIGVIAGVQRGYFRGNEASCTKIGTITITVVAGPLNYLGANPRVVCTTPQPSK